MGVLSLSMAVTKALLAPHRPPNDAYMHTGGGSMHAEHAAPARLPRVRALVCVAAALEGVRGEDTTSWTAEGMSEASAAVVTTGPGAVMGVVAVRTRQQRLGPRSTHSVSNRVQRQLLRSRRQNQNAASCSQKIVRAERSKGKPADMTGRFYLAGVHGRLILCASRLTRCTRATPRSIAQAKG